jgi:hypothetical protein
MVPRQEDSRKPVAQTSGVRPRKTHRLRAMKLSRSPGRMPRTLFFGPPQTPVWSPPTAPPMLAADWTIARAEVRCPARARTMGAASAFDREMRKLAQQTLTGAAATASVPGCSGCQTSSVSTGIPGQTSQKHDLGSRPWSVRSPPRYPGLEPMTDSVHGTVLGREPAFGTVCHGGPDDEPQVFVRCAFTSILIL